MSTPKVVLDLVDRFRLHKDAYRSTKYNEAQVRKEFVDPLFKALGWDMDNERGYAEAYKDVLHEDSLKVGGNVKAPDYAFRIGGTRKFFLEAKKPSVNIKGDINAAYQLRRYAWSAKLSLSILTDFEEFSVYDCRLKPQKGDKASVARIAYFTFDDYSHKWHEISDVFSRDAILKGSFDKFATDNKRKRGTAEVDDVFLEEIERWRTELARNIALRNQHLSVRELNIAVQRTIDRLIFLRIAEDRGIEPYGALRHLQSGKTIYSRLAQIFRDADDRYNSGLFHFRENDGVPETLDTFTLDLKIDDRILKNIIRHLYYPESPYEFSVLPADILGQIYERFLGKTIRLAGRRAVIEEKPEIKKAGGVYYTPTYIVRYIVDNTVGSLLRGKSPLQISGQDKRTKDGEPLRIMDPACGSGSFLISAYQFLLDWYRDQYLDDGVVKHSKGKSPRLYQTGNNEWRLSIAERRRILLTHIYGVDVDPQAVEITKLSLLLKVLEGESSDAIANQMDLFQLRALPDLGNNIRCGNSLIEPDFYRIYEPDLFSDEEQYQINAFAWNNEFKFLSTCDGFHCIIGNPPYLYSAGQANIEYFNEKYHYSQYQTDFYVYFTEKGLNLLRPGGILGFITPDSWMNLDNFSIFRNGLINEWSLVKVCIFGYQVFRGANIENTILVAKNGRRRAKFDVIRFESPRKFIKYNTLRTNDVNRIGIVDHHYSRDAESIIEKLDVCTKLGSLVLLNRGIHAYRTDGYGKSAFDNGPQTKRDKNERSYHSRTRKNKTYLPEVRGRDVFWFRYRYSGMYISYGKWLAEPRNPDFILKPKVVFRKTLGPWLSVALIEEAAAVDQALYIAISKDGNQDMLKFILGITGSAIGAWYLRTKYAIYDRLHPWYTKKQLENFPIPSYSKKVVRLVDELLTVCDHEEKANVEQERRHWKNRREALAGRLNRAVFAAYGLDEEQAGFIHNRK